MKKLSFLMTGLCLLMFSCSHEPKDPPLYGSLYKFSEKSADNTTVLTGVRDAKTDKCLIKADDYLSVKADENVIICKDQRERSHIYLHNGESLGTFDMFTRWKDDWCDYYIGTSYNSRTFYFPQKKTLLTAKTAYFGIDFILLELKDHWITSDYNGNEQWRIARNFTLLKERQDKRPDKLYLAMSNAKGGCILYDGTGKTVKKLTAARWKKLKKTFQNQQPLGSAEYAEISGISEN